MHREFAKIFKQFYPPVKSFVKKLVKCDADAEDIAQDVFTQLWAKPDVWQGNSEIGRYIYRMAKYQSLNFIRDNARIADLGLVDAGLDLIEAVRSEVSAVDPIIHDEAQLLLTMTLEKMPPKRREIFMLSRFENLSNREIAERLGLSVRTVESHIYSALQTLKAAFPDRHAVPS